MTRLTDSTPTMPDRRPLPSRFGKTLCAAAVATTLVAFGAGDARAQQDAASAAPPAAGFSELVKAKLPAVVTVTSTREVSPEQRLPLPQFPPGSPFERFFDEFGEQFGLTPDAMPPSRPSRALGSGFIVDPEGYIVTNNHVIQDADEVQVILNDDRELPAEVVGTDPATDLALLKVESDKPLPTLEWGDANTAEVGDWVVAIGNPFGLGGTVTAGIISARARDINAGPYDDFIQTDAAINQGNSGGPLLNLEGEVIGVNTAIFSQSGGSIGIGFAIPSDLARPLIQELRETGEVRRGWLGVSIQPVTDEIAEALGLDQAEGALVSSVVEGSPADEAGIEVGDVIVNFADEEIEDPRELSRVVAETAIESTVDVAVVREGDRQTLDVTIARLDREQQMAAIGAPPAEADEDVAGLALTPLTPEARAEFGIDETEEAGAVVAEVMPGSPAEEAGLQPGDLITRIGGQTVEAPEDVVSAIEDAREAGRNSVLVLTERQGQAIFVPLTLG